MCVYVCMHVCVLCLFACMCVCLCVTCNLIKKPYVTKQENFTPLMLKLLPHEMNVLLKQITLIENLIYSTDTI